MNGTRSNHRRLRVEPLEERICLSADPAVIPVHANAFGTSYGELAGGWWNWLAKEPLATNPGAGGPCEVNQSGKVWFLPASIGGELNSACTIPTGKAVFVAVLVAVASPDDPGEFPDQEDEVRGFANFAADAVASVNATIDEVEINAWNYRAESPQGGFTWNLPEGSIFTELFGAPAGSYSPAVADGYWLLLHPLSAGSHTLSFGGEVVIDGEVVFVAQTNLELEVVGGKKPEVQESLPGALALVGLPEGSTASTDAADDDDSSNIIQTPASAVNIDALTPASTYDNAIVDILSLDQHELQIGDNASDDSLDSELLTLLAKDR